MNKITMLYLSGDSAEFIQIKPDLETYYDLLNCATIDIVNIYIGGKVYEVICDDEGLYKSPLHFSVITKSMHPLIVGKVLVCNSEDGKEKSLNISDVIHLTRALCWTSQGGEPIAALLADD